MSTNDAYTVLREADSLSRTQKIMLARLRRIYRHRRQRIYSVFAYEDFAVKLFYCNLDHVQGFRDLYGFWFVVLTFVAFTNKKAMILCQDVLMQNESVSNAWIANGRYCFTHAPSTTFKSSTRRGNVARTRMQKLFIQAMDRLFDTSPTTVHSQYRDAHSGAVFVDDVIAGMVQRLALPSIGPFKRYFVSKMLHHFDHAFVHRFHAGPSVSISNPTSALTMLFPSVHGQNVTSQELLQRCLELSSNILPLALHSKLTLDDMEHAACEWMRTLRCG